jgi:hypothetical protein
LSPNLHFFLIVIRRHTLFAPSSLLHHVNFTLTKSMTFLSAIALFWNAITTGFFRGKTHFTAGVIQSLLKALHTLHEPIDESWSLETMIESSIETLVQRWRRRDGFSEQAFQARPLADLNPDLQGMLSVLEFCLQQCNHTSFEHLINALGYNTVQFWQKAVPYIFDSDMAFGTKFRDTLLFSLTLFDVNNGKNRLR